MAASASGDAVTEWNSAMLNAIRAQRQNPPMASRAMAILHVAIHDTVNGIERRYRPYLFHGPAPEGASLPAAIAAAGYRTTITLYTNENIRMTNFLALYEAQLADIPEGPARDAGLQWGETVAHALLEHRAGDGSTNVAEYTPVGAPGTWKPTPPAFAPALLPGWGLVKAFCLPSVAEMRPQAPPPTTSAAYAFEFNIVKLLGGANSIARTEEQSEIARFWDDGAGTVTPPGHWNLIAQGVSAERGVDLVDNARLFALLNMALADAAICSWDAKFAYHYVRPATAIAEAAEDGNPDTEPEEGWTSFITTPPFPEYTSGHSTFSRSAATVLAGFFGTDAIPFSTTSDLLPGVTRSFPGFSAAADEAGLSRIYGGIHWPSANLHGQSGGYQIGTRVVKYFLRPYSDLQFTAVGRADGQTQLVVEAEPNRSYVIQASSDLNTWETIATLSSESGTLQFQDVNAPEGGLRFYRAVSEE